MLGQFPTVYRISRCGVLHAALGSDGTTTGGGSDNNGNNGNSGNNGGGTGTVADGDENCHLGRGIGIAQIRTAASITVTVTIGVFVPKAPMAVLGPATCVKVTMIVTLVYVTVVFARGLVMITTAVTASFPVSLICLPKT